MVNHPVQHPPPFLQLIKWVWQLVKSVRDFPAMFYQPVKDFLQLVFSLRQLPGNIRQSKVLIRESPRYFQAQEFWLLSNQIARMNLKVNCKFPAFVK